MDEDDWITGAPEFVVEVASSSESYDLHTKKWAYEAAGVREYLTVLLRENAVRWFVLRSGRYEELALGSDRVFRSEVFPGLWLDAEALLQRNVAGVLQVLQQGLASEEHAAFVSRLRPASE